MTRDYYEVLGVERTASKTVIKRAFRRLARELHPDVNDSEDAEERFKEISEAYEVISDDVKRGEYDNSDDNVEMYENGFDWNDFTKYDDIRDIFGAYSSPSEVYLGRQRYHAPQMGKSVIQGIKVTLKEVVTGGSRLIEVPYITECTKCHGSGAFPGTGVEMCPVCRGLGQVKQINTRGFNRYVTIQSCIRCLGKGKITGRPCDECHGRGTVSSTKELDVKIPPGVTDGTTLRVEGEGHEGIMGGRRGDLYVRVSVIPDDRFERDGSDLITLSNISFTQAALGSNIEVETFNGRASVKVPAGTQTDTLLRLKGKGLPRMQAPGKGDLLVRVVVRTPESLTPRQRELLMEIAKEGGEAAVAPKERKGLFKRFKFFQRD